MHPPYAHVCTLFDLYYKFLISFLVIISYSYLSAGTVAGRLIILGYSLYPGLSCLCEPLVVLVDQGLREEVWTVSRLGLCHRRYVSAHASGSQIQPWRADNRSRS